MAPELTGPEQVAVWNRRMDELAARDTTADPMLVQLVSKLDIGLKQALDIGCGAGRHLCWLAQEGWVATGVDWSSEALETTKRRLATAGLKATVLKGDNKRLPFDNNSFPLVVCTNVLHHGRLAEFARSAAEIKRVLRIGGYAVVSVPSLEHPGAGRPGSWIEPGTLLPSSGPETGIPHHYFTENEIRRDTAQFRDVSIELTEEVDAHPRLPGEEGTQSEQSLPTGEPPVWDGSMSVDLTATPPLTADPLSGRTVAPASPPKPVGGIHGGWYWIVLKG